jgi:PilZ domain
MQLLEKPRKFRFSSFDYRDSYRPPPADGCALRTAPMQQEPTVMNERRNHRRFTVHAPVSLNIHEAPVTGLTRDMSNRGLFVYLRSVEGIERDQRFDFVVELPSEITLSSGCKISCTGRVVRVVDKPADLTGIALEILNYTISRWSNSDAS